MAIENNCVTVLPAPVLTWMGGAPRVAPDATAKVAVADVNASFHVTFENATPGHVVDSRTSHRLVPAKMTENVEPGDAAGGDTDVTAGGALGQTVSGADTGSHCEFSVFRMAVKTYFPAAVVELVEIAAIPPGLPETTGAKPGQAKIVCTGPPLNVY